MTVYQQRRVLDAQLKRVLSGEFIVATNPDHPLLLRGPDVLIGGRSGLTAVLCPTAQERRFPKKAMARFSLSRMALPAHARFVLAITERDHEVGNALARDVAAVLFTDRPKDLVEIARVAEHPASVRQAEIPMEVQLEARRRFAVTYRVGRLSRRRALRMSLRADDDRDASTASMRKIRGIPRDFAELSIQGAERSFVLDDGVPYPTGEPSAPVIADRVPEFLGDPEKYLRASAFAGWALLDREPIDDDDLLRFLDVGTRPRQQTRPQ